MTAPPLPSGSGPKTPVWEGVYQTFAEVAGDDAVFEGSVWLDKVVARAVALRAAAANPAAIAPAAVSSDYVLPVVAAIAARPGQVLRILDFGGGMAASYVSLCATLPAARLHFVVVENERLCTVGRELFENDAGVAFSTAIPSGESFDIVHAGSSIHYVDDWKGLLARFAALRPAFLIFADLPAGDIQTFVTAQNYYGRRIPVRFWHLGEFVSAVEALGYELVYQSRFRGYYLAAGEELRTENFPAPYRLTHTSQLIFRHGTSR